MFVDAKITIAELYKSKMSNIMEERENNNILKHVQKPIEIDDVSKR